MGVDSGPLGPRPGGRDARRTRATRDRRRHRHDHQRQAREAQRVRRRHGPRPVRDPGRAEGATRTSAPSSGGPRASRSRRAATSPPSAGEQVTLTHHELMRRGHKGILQIFDIEAPIIVAMKGWSIGASFQRALICDIRIAAEGCAVHAPRGHPRRHPRHRRHGPALPDVRPRRRHRHGAHRPGDAGRRGAAPTASCRGSSPPDDLDSTAFEMAEKIAAAPAVTIKMARRVIKHLVRARRCDRRWRTS